MHPEYIQTAPGGAGWYILAEDGRTLEGGPFPSEEATWAEITRLTPREEPHQRSTPPRPSPRQPRRS